MEEIVKAYNEWRAAQKAVHNPADNYKSARWDSPERKAMRKAEDAFDAAVRDSEYSHIFEDYASNHDSERM